MLFVTFILNDDRHIWRVRVLYEGVGCEWTTFWEKVNFYTICNQLLSHDVTVSASQRNCQFFVFFFTVILIFLGERSGSKRAKKRDVVIGYTEKVKRIVALMNLHDQKEGYFIGSLIFSSIRIIFIYFWINSVKLREMCGMIRFDLILIFA